MINVIANANDASNSVDAYIDSLGPRSSIFAEFQSISRILASISSILNSGRLEC